MKGKICREYLENDSVIERRHPTKTSFIEERHFDGIGRLMYIKSGIGRKWYSYDDRNNNIRTVYLSDSGNILHIENMEYNEYGLLVSKSIITNGEYKGEILVDYDFTKDENGKIIKYNEKTHNTLSIISYSKDENDRTYTILYDEMGELQCVISRDDSSIYKWDSRKNLIYMRSSEGEIFMNYDDHNNLIHEKIYDKEENTYTYEYNEHGDMIRCTEYGTGFTEPYVTVCKWEYDVVIECCELI